MTRIEVILREIISKELEGTNQEILSIIPGRDCITKESYTRINLIDRKDDTKTYCDLSNLRHDYYVREAIKKIVDPYIRPLNMVSLVNIIKPMLPEDLSVDYLNANNVFEYDDIKITIYSKTNGFVHTSYFKKYAPLSVINREVYTILEDYEEYKNNETSNDFINNLQDVLKKTGYLDTDMVRKPPHYKGGEYECIKVMKSIFTKEEVSAWEKLNAFKYLWRANKKNGNEDIKKANYYLNDLTKDEKEQ